jgi:hypothetical protein
MFWETNYNDNSRKCGYHSLHDLGQSKKIKKEGNRDPGYIPTKSRLLGYTIHKILDMKKLSAKWIPKCPNPNQKHDRMLAVKANYIYIYDPETKEQYKEWSDGF